MIKAKNKQLVIDYQSSYFYRQRRKQQRKRWLKGSLLLLTLAILILAASLVQAATGESASHVHENPLISGPQLLFDHPDASLRSALPLDLQADIEINGLMVYTEIKQVFINPHQVTLEGKYQFPLPENAAVNYLKVKIGKRVIEGKIMEKQQAKRAYIKAKQSGQKASLVEQQRPNLFTNKIANIPPQTKVEVTLKLISTVSYQDGKFNLALPLAMTSRYQAKDAALSPAETASEFFNITDSSLTTSQASIQVELNAGVAITHIVSNSHRINSQALNNHFSHYQISLDKPQVKADRQFQLQWQLNADEQPQVTSFSEQIAGDYYTLLTFLPPTHQSAQPLPRDLIFIIDTSGSMQGGSINQAKASLQQALSLLTPQDSFNIIAFNSETEQLFHHSEMVSERTMARAQHFIDQLRAEGGTEMYRPLNNALMMGKTSDQHASAIRQLIFITDGAVSNEFELMQLLQTAIGNARLFTVGIGRAPNGYFMKKAAQFGRGSYVFIQQLNQVQNNVSALMNKISEPVLSNIELILNKQIHQGVEIYPKQLPDLYNGQALQVAIKSSLPINHLQVQGDTTTALWHKQLIINDNQNAVAISTLWARRKIEELLDSLVTASDPETIKTQVIATSIAHQIISPYTSFIALENQPFSPPLLAKNNTTPALKLNMPQTALGWQPQLLFGLILLIIAALIFRARASDNDG
ncbi:marine proteobacterial sortase target protein [Thalassotalea insulae]|uniref:Marine proteobacterial sortase target protein n=1 Tax=Thalassotalea insulae TaxID=2056778 RepID=A0ABQ6GR09_9GAMM|nr:marine proteobacterial sortase target protein [Thalassotalea insulae]GLX76997.1 marine proteobacterial sortase target protein [Thalassotalea insulae]